MEEGHWKCFLGVRADGDLQGGEGIPGKSDGGREDSVIKLAKLLCKYTYPQFSSNNGHLWGRRGLGLG